ncbi:MAG: substrate-binding domain-containing protein [Capsulimonas sp.]|uniref:substrate-binding domain-containing protein n=1 Tax=Capsulimonas sp. TaxID=2494211 RepID=UPI003262D3EB
MAAMRGKCTNFGNCQKADSGEFIDLPPGSDPVCPICGRPLNMIASAGGGRPSPIPLIIGVLVLFLLGYLVVHFIQGRGKKPQTASTSTMGTNTSNGGSNFGGTPAATSAPAVKPGDALMYYERSAESWLRPAADEFNAQHSGQPQIVLDYRGSREGKQDILYGQGKPVIWNPADTYWADKLNLDWRNPKVGKHSEDVVDESKTILSTRLVIVAWDDRAKVLSAAMNRAEYRGKTWLLMHDIATQGWSKIGGQASWGKLKLAQTDPTKSNSGQAAVVLMFAEYSKSHPGVTPSSPSFLSFMRGVEGSVPKFETTTSKALDALVKGSRDQYDAAIAYETNALAAVDGGNTDIRILYPSPTVPIDLPAAIIKADWVDNGEAQLAKQFVDFLLTRDIQKKAIAQGFRPALPDMRADVDNAFSSGARGDAGFVLDPPTVTRPVSTRVIDDILYQWYKIYGGGGAAPV